MNFSVERLRVWLLAGAVLLVVVIAGFLGYAHYRAHRLLTNLPKRLGVDIRRETNGYTYSQSIKGRTVYTIHASRAVEHLNGKITLHDVGIVLYGRQQNRADRIYGNEFEYDQAAEVIRAVGLVHIDLQAPQPQDAGTRMDYAAGKDLGADSRHLPDDPAHEDKDPKLIHVTTSGLVFLRKLGTAATDNEIEFESGGLTGHAVGADYNSDSGIVVLHSVVKVNGVEDGRPFVLTSSRAELNRPAQTVILAQAKYISVGGAQGTQTAQGEHVIVHLRKDGSAEKVDAEGDVALSQGSGARITAPRSTMMLNEHNRIQSGVMTGGVRYSSSDPLRQGRGEAAEMRVAFDANGSPEHVTMTGAVHLSERLQTSSATGQPDSERELNANALDLALGADASGKTGLRDVRATDKARLSVRNTTWTAGKPVTTSIMLGGDVLTAHFVRIGNTDHISEVHGDGHAMLRRTDAKGVLNTSSADSLIAHFQPITTGASQKPVSGGKVGSASSTSAGRDEIADAVEQGHVELTQLPAPRPGEPPPAEQRATAGRAEYNGQLQRTIMTGNVQVSDSASVLWADRVITEQKTGEATADGSVKASYRQPGSTADPVHVLASRAEVNHDSQVAIFYGVPGRPARLWQESSQIEAPVLQFDQKQRRLQAHGAGAGAPMAVHTVLVSTGSSDSPAAKTSTSGNSRAAAKTTVIRVQSRDLVYSDSARRADFTGGVAVESADGSMQAQQVAVFLQPSPATDDPTHRSTAAKSGSIRSSPRGAVPADSFMTGDVERIVATGSIQIEQPGRRATGEKIVYTAEDGLFILTGTPALPPKVNDQEHGTITGPSLRFHSGDQDVVVSNGGDAHTEQRVHTETRVKNKQ